MRFGDVLSWLLSLHGLMSLERLSLCSPVSKLVELRKVISEKPCRREKWGSV